MTIKGVKIWGECQYCEKILECKKVLNGMGIGREKTNVTEMIACQIDHEYERNKNNN